MFLIIQSCTKDSSNKSSYDLKANVKDTTIENVDHSNQSKSIDTTLKKSIVNTDLDSIPLRTPDGNPARYGVESAEIELEYSGNVKGNRTIKFDKFGSREIRTEKSIPYPEASKGRIQNYTMLTTLDTFGVTDNITKDGWVQKNTLDDDYLKSDSSKKMSFGEYVISKAQGVIVRNENVIGKNCTVYERSQNGVISTLWIWKGIILKEEYSSPQDSVQYKLIPKKLSLNMKYQDSTFKLSSDFVMKDLTKNPPKKIGNSK